MTSSLDYFSVFLGKIKDAFDRNPELQNLLLDDFFKSAVESCQVGSPGRWRGHSVRWALLWGIDDSCHFGWSPYLSVGVVSLAQDSWRRAISTGVQAGIPMPCFTTALSFYDGYRHDMLPANLIQVSAGRRWQHPPARGLRSGPACDPNQPHFSFSRLSGITLGLTPTSS